MRFPNAAKGVKKIFSAEILSLIGALVGGVMTTLIIVLGISANAQDDIGVGITFTLVIVLGIAALAIVLVGGILNIVGYIQAAIDESDFRKAIFCTVLYIIFSVASTLIGAQTGFLGWLATAFHAISQIAKLCVTLFAIGGLMNLSAECNRSDLVEKGRNILTVIVWIYVISFVMIFMTRVFRESVVNTTIASILSVVVIVLGIIEYVLYLSYLLKTSKMLSEN